MKRLIFSAVVLAFFGLGQARAQLDEVIYIDRAAKKEVSIRGKVEKESPAGVSVKERTTNSDIAAADIVQINYYSTAVPVVDFRAPFGRESRALTPGTNEKTRKELLAEALKGYEGNLPKLTGNAKRYVQFKIAMCKAAQSEAEQGKQDAAISALQAFTTEHPDGWQIVTAAKTLARLLEDKGDVAGARKAYEALGKVNGIPPTTKLESDVLVAKLLMRGKNFADAETKLKSLSTTLPTDNPQKPLLTVLLAQAQMEQNNLAGVEALLKGAIAATEDGAIRGLAHNTLGDYYLKKNQAEDGFWEYLRVDVLYSQDRDQQAKALYHLSKLFDKVKNDPLRAAEYKNRLLDKNFDGLEYAKKAASEK